MRGHILQQLSALAATLCLLVCPVMAANAVSYDANGFLPAIQEPEEDILPLIFCRGTDDLTASAVQWQEGRTGQGVYLDGQDAYFRADGDAFTGDAFTLAFWVNWVDGDTAPGGQCLFSLRGSNRDTRNITMVPADAEHGLMVTAQCDGIIHQLAIDRPLVSGWQHLSITWKDSTLRFYINSRLVGETTEFVSMSTFAPRQFCLGKGMRTGQSGYFHGLFDDVFLFNRELSRDELRDIVKASLEENPIESDKEEGSSADASASLPEGSAEENSAQQQEIIPRDPLFPENRLYLLVIPVVAVIGILATVRPWKKR